MTETTPARARWAVAATFLLHGMLVGAWVPHIPLAKDRIEAGPAVFGLALLAFAAGAVAAMPMKKPAMMKVRNVGARMGPKKVMQNSKPVMGVSLALP